MNNFWEYMFDLVNSIKTDKISERISKAGFTLETDEDEDGTGKYVQKTLVRSNSDDTMVLAYHRSSQKGTEFKYFTDDYDMTDMRFCISKKSIHLVIGEEVYKNIDKSDYFNITVGYDGNSVVDFDIITELQKHVKLFEGIVILYAPNEQIEYGYV